MLKIKSQQGIGLIVFFLTVLAAGAMFFLSTTNNDDNRISNENDSTKALAQAKAALLSYAVNYYETASTGGTPHAGRHGLLPCPESTDTIGSEGGEAISCGNGSPQINVNNLGRLPWKTLDLSPLKDASGECLWYAVSGDFTNNPQAPMTNEDTPGMFQVFNEQANLEKGNTPENRIVAVVIAPGKPLSGQNRRAADFVNGQSAPCKVLRQNVDPTDYLDVFQGIDNAVVDSTTQDSIHQFIMSNGINPNPALNDRMITITANEIFTEIQKNPVQYANKFEELGVALGQCLIEYANAVADQTNAPEPEPETDPVYDDCMDNCYADCNSAQNLCLLTNTGPGKSDCRPPWARCNQECRRSCGGAGGNSNNNNNGGGSGTARPLLPWPASINLDADYRIDNNYIDLDNAAEGHFGRLPYLTTFSQTALSAGDPDIFTNCSINNEMLTLWQNWKDHWFYVVGSNFSPSAVGTTLPVPCDDCPEDSAGNKHAAILIFAGTRTANQLRRSVNIDPATLPANSKAVLSNYLEGSNSANYPDNTGNQNNRYGLNGVNDRLFCINQDLTIATNPVTACSP